MGRENESPLCPEAIPVVLFNVSLGNAETSNDAFQNGSYLYSSIYFWHSHIFSAYNNRSMEDRYAGNNINAERMFVFLKSQMILVFLHRSIEWIFSFSFSMWSLLKCWCVSEPSIFLNKYTYYLSSGSIFGRLISYLWQLVDRVGIPFGIQDTRAHTMPQPIIIDRPRRKEENVFYFHVRITTFL